MQKTKRCPGICWHGTDITEVNHSEAKEEVCQKIPRDRKRKEGLGCTPAALAIDGVLAGQIALAGGSKFTSGWQSGHNGEVTGEEISRRPARCDEVARRELIPAPAQTVTLSE